jgi:hypothetical protein
MVRSSSAVSEAAGVMEGAVVVAVVDVIVREEGIIVVIVVAVVAVEEIERIKAAMALVLVRGIIHCLKRS